MKILLINPPQIVNVNYGRPYIFQPLGLLYIAASLEREKKYKIEIFDAALDGWRNLKIVKNKYYLGIPFENIQKKIKISNPDIIGITVPFSINSESAHLVCSAAKQTNNHIITILGGPHPTVHPMQVLADKNVDFVVTGEGEITIVELIHAISEKKFNNLKKIQGIGFKKKDEIIINSPRPLINKLDSLSFPSRHLVPMNEYFIAMSDGGGARQMYTFGNSWVTMITSRGCPFNCNFCSIHLSMGKKFRGRSPENVIKEIKKVLIDYKVKHINFEDDNLTLNKTRAKKLFDLIIKENLNITWSTPNGIRADTLDEELVIKMKESGCIRVFVAPESGDQWVVDNIIGKKQDLTKVYEAVKLFKKYNIIVDGSFVLGSIGETKWNVIKTIMFAKKLKRAGMEIGGFHMATPYYGTPLYEEAKNKGFLTRESDDSFSTWEPLISTPTLNSRTLYRLHKFAQWYVNLTLTQKIKFIILKYFPIIKKGMRKAKMSVKLIKSIIVKIIKISDLIRGSIKYKLMKRRNELPKIENIVYEVTNACNSHCKHCFMWKNTPLKGMLKPKELEKILKQNIFSDVKVVLLTGGEPVLRKDIKELISAIHNAIPGVRITLSTNGILAEKVLEVAKFGIEKNILIDYGISLDGIGDAHNLSRGTKGNFEKVDYLLQEMIKLRKIYPDKIGLLLLGHTLSNLTVDTLLDVKSYAEKNGVPFVTQLYEQFSYYGNTNKKSNAKNYKRENNTEIIKKIKLLNPSFQNEIIISALKHKLKFTCSALSSYFVLKPDGFITPCLNFSEMSIGNIKSLSFEDIWKSERAIAVRNNVHNCEGCSNSWATSWSFRNWPYPFIPMIIKLNIKRMLYYYKK